MFKMIRQLFSLLTPSQIRKFYILQVLVVVMAFTELLGVASIAPFMALVGDISLVEQGGIFTTLYNISGASTPMDFLFYSGVLVLVTLFLSTIMATFTIWQLSLYASGVGTQLADRLYNYYLQQDWLFHATGSSAHLTKQVSSETLRVTDYIIQPLMSMNAKVVLSLFISISIFIYDPLVAIAASLLFVCAYILIYKVVRKRLFANGHNISKMSTERFRLMNEGFGGIKDVLLLNRRYDFVERFKKSGETFAYARGTTIAISQMPRYFMELITFGAMIGLVLLLIIQHQGSLGTILPILAVYALAAFKLLPALQQIYSSVVEIKGNAAAFEALKEDLIQSVNNHSGMANHDSALSTKTGQTAATPNLPLQQQVSLKNITFTYPGKPSPALLNVNMNIPANSVIGIVGASGSGKSTVIDVLLGLLTPQLGELSVDGTVLTADNKRLWQNNLGFVPQSIFLSEGTIAENVAFGLPAKDIDEAQVNKALQLANLSELIAQLPEGLNTKVGERGVQLSGGQRQRIGIARALYHEANVLVFDEATSALDDITEKIIMEAIHEFSGQKTIIMIAHRLKTVQKCDIIYLMDQGKVVNQGTYQELVASSSQFKKMAEHA